MSSIFGIFHRDNKAVDKEIIYKMSDSMSYWHPDDRGMWFHDQVALGHAMLWNTPESKFEKLPAKQDHIVITMDARLDNRSELALQLEVPNFSHSRITDSDLILRSYLKWGEQCPRYLLGDFSFVIWDEIGQKLFCARDHVGVKQFYFHLSDKLFVFANDLKGLVSHHIFPLTINNSAVANYLVNHQLVSSTLTFFNDIIKLDPAHTLTITSQHVKKRCYWKLEDAPAVKLSKPEDYIEKLRQLLEQAVHDRIRSSYQVTSHLSGGLDSSSIAVIAARKLREKNRQLLAFNWLHEPGEEDDTTHYEWSNSKSIAKAENIEHHYLSLSTSDVYTFITHHDIAYGATTVFWYEYPLRQAAQNKGSRTILSGWGGDELATYHGQSFYSDLLVKGKIWKLFHELIARIAKGNKGIKPILGTIYYKLFIPLIPRSLHGKIIKRAGRKPPFAFVRQEFMVEVNKELKKKSALSMQPQKTIRAHMLAYWYNAHIQSRVESWASDAVASRLEYTYPLLDKRIMEFVIGAPPECFVKNGVGRHLFRSAIKGLLAEKIIWSDAKYEPRRVERLAGMVLSSSKMITADEKFKAGPDSYINRQKIFELLNTIDHCVVSKTSLNTLAEAETALLLSISKAIQYSFSKGKNAYECENTLNGLSQSKGK